MQGDPAHTPTNPLCDPAPSPTDNALSSPKQTKSNAAPRRPRKPGRPATYVFDKPDDQLTEKERKMKVSIEKRRLRQNRSYHRRKKLGNKPNPALPTSAATAAAVAAATAAAASAAAATAATALPHNPPPLDAMSEPISESLHLHTSTATSAAPSVQVQHSALAAHPHTFAPIHIPRSNALSMTNDVLSSSSIPIQHSASAISVPAPPAPATVPKLIPGFSQNPLELLASATADRTNPSPIAQNSLDVHPPLTAVDPDKMPIDSTCDLTSSAVHISTAVAHPSADTDSSAAMAVVPSIDETLQFDATSQPVDASSFSFHIDSEKRTDSNEEEDDESTEALVNNALVAAKEYARDSINLKNVMDRETELRRMTGIKTIVFDNLRSKYASMSSKMQSALRHLVIFPRTFNLGAATAVGGFADSDLVTVQGMLDSMIQTNFITTSKGRYELNDAARLFLNEDPEVVNDNFASGTYDIAQKRFIAHYQKQLAQLQDDDIHKIGFLREKAMALFDSERENMEFSEYLLNGRHNELREFLSAGITVMRYCVGASSRERALRKALLETEEDVTEDNALLEFESNQGVKELSSSSSVDIRRKNDNSHRARLFLALSEAYFDQLKLAEAEQPLLEALKLMRTMNPRGGSTPSSSIVDSVLVLLLLSNLRLSANRVKDARVLCVKALRILAEAGLGRSTFGINAMSNLVTIYLMEGHLDKAKSVASRLLDTLNTMSYTGMPIYADALGVCATVSMAESNFKEAERQYNRALETVGKWGSKEWTGIPVQHCLDLDLWLMEGMADAIRRQGKVVEAMVLEERAAQDRMTRGLPKNNAAAQADVGPSTDPGNVGRPSLRHLY